MTPADAAPANERRRRAFAPCQRPAQGNPSPLTGPLPPLGETSKELARAHRRTSIRYGIIMPCRPKARGLRHPLDRVR